MDPGSRDDEVVGGADDLGGDRVGRRAVAFRVVAAKRDRGIAIQLTERGLVQRELPKTALNQLERTCTR